MERRIKEQFATDNIEHYERASLPVAEDTARKRVAAADDQQLKIRAEQGRKVYLRQQKDMQAWQNLPLSHPLKNLVQKILQGQESSGGL